MTLCREMGYLMVEASALLNLAEIEMKQDEIDYAQAKSWLETGLQISQKIGDKQKTARGHKLTADYLLAVGQLAAAWNALIEGLTIVWEVKALPSLFELLIGVANFFLKTDELELASKTVTVIGEQTGTPQHIKQQAVDLQTKHSLPLSQSVPLETFVNQIFTRK